MFALNFSINSKSHRFIADYLMIYWIYFLEGNLWI